MCVCEREVFLVDVAGVGNVDVAADVNVNVKVKVKVDVVGVLVEVVDARSQCECRSPENQRVERIRPRPFPPTPSLSLNRNRNRNRNHTLTLTLTVTRVFYYSRTTIFLLAEFPGLSFFSSLAAKWVPQIWEIVHRANKKIDLGSCKCGILDSGACRCGCHFGDFHSMIPFDVWC